jgi:F-type H+-transporting ATPase subunit b
MMRIRFGERQPFMKFNFWTLAFQVINFIVLLVILRRILYKPVRAIIEKRRGIIEQKVRDAEQKEKEAQALKIRYEAELDSLPEQKARMFERIQQEADEERTKLMSRAREDALRVEEREKALLGAEKQVREAEIKESVLDSVAVFSSRIMRDIADDTLHDALFHKFLKEFERNAPELMRSKDQTEAVQVELAAARPLVDKELQVARETIQRFTANKVMVTGTIDPTLIAGVRMRADDMVFDASLAGQIAAMKEKLKGNS